MATAGKGKVSKLLGGGLLLLLVAGLAGFGATNFGGSVSSIGRVGDAEISATDYARALQNELRALGQQTGENVTFAQAQQFGVPASVLQRLIADAALENEAGKAGISVGDATVAEQIRDIPSFQGPDGNFDPESYRFALGNANLNARDFERTIRAEQSRALLQSAVAAGVVLPTTYVDTLMDYVGQRRDLAWVTLDPLALSDPIGAPSDADLQAYYDAHPDDFTLPAAKNITYAWLSPEMIMNDADVSDEDLRQLYEARIAEYVTPEKRLVERLVYGSEDEAAAAKTAIDAGETDFDAAVEARGLELADADLGDVAREDLPPAVAEEIFALEAPGVVGPLQSDLGPALYRMNAILEGNETSFEDVRRELADEFMAERARRDIAARVDAIDDLLASGATLEDLAQETDMTLGTIRWTPETDADIAAFDEFHEIAAAVQDGDFPEVHALSDGGIFALRLDSEDGPSLQPLEDVRVGVIQGWEAEETTNRLIAQAETLQGQLTSGTPIDELGDVQRATDMVRSDFIDDTPAELLGTAFTLDEGENAIVSGTLDGSPAVALLLVEAVRAPDESNPDMARLKEQLAEQAQQGVSSDLLEGYVQALRLEEGVELRQSAVNAVHSSFPLMAQLTPSFDAFAVAHAGGANQLVYARIAADLDTPVSLMLKLSEARKDSFVLESVTGGEVRGRYSIVGMKPDLIWRCHGTEAQINRQARIDAETFQDDPRPPLDALRALIAESRIDIPADLPAASAGLFGYLGYDMIRLVEHLPNVNPDPLDLPDAVLIRPSVVAVLDGVKGEVIVCAPAWASSGLSARAAYNQAAERVMDALRDLDRVTPVVSHEMGDGAELGEATSNFSHAAYLEAVEKAKEYIRAGDIFQVVPSQRWKMDFPLPPFALYRSLRRTNPSPFMFFFNFGGFQVIGASPEILVRVFDGEVTIRPIAGTRKRGATPEEDRALEADLLADKKELAEHLMLLDLGRNDTGRVSRIGTVHPTEKFIVERYSHVMHIVSNVVGELSDDHDALSALLAGLPAGTVSGAPKVRAMEIIDELEPEKRGVYGGGVGYFSAGGDMDMCIALRTAVLKDAQLYIQSGGGVVFDSDPQSEFEETENKARAIRQAAIEAGRFTTGRNS